MSDNSYQLDSRHMRRSFEAAADSYDSVAVLQQEVARRLDERLQVITLQPTHMLDLGSGTGFSSRLLVRRYPQAHLLALDIARPMLQRSRQHEDIGNSGHVCADMQRLPLADNCMELVFSSLALQWCQDPAVVFREVARVLKPGGLFLFSSFGPATLQELRDSWSRADEYVHVNRFIDMHDLGDVLMQQGLQGPVMEQELFTLTYDTVHKLMRDLQALGARNVNQGRARGLTGKGRLAAMQQAYESFRQQGRLPASYEVIYGHAWAGEARAEKVNPVKEMRRGMRVEFEQYLRMQEDPGVDGDKGENE
jgi:malonyl-CoA O-methyltransferase